MRISVLMYLRILSLSRASRNSLFDASAFGASDCLAITFIVFLQHFILMVVVDRMTGRSRGFGFVTFDEEKAMEDAIDRMHGMMLDDRNITVDKAQSRSGGGDRGNSGGGGRGYTEGSHGGPASERYKSDRTGPYDRPSGSGYRSSCDDRH